ncbi:MAG: cytochrome c biogenesis protein CcdA [Spirochaetaceae bacterium]|jgi:cytochrome c-type biogenesis protein|nr:cytochrome c biogenesis protein CcdA [Spirochaetaceae bacterium]
MNVNLSVNLSIATAFFAGLLSFVSPCVLPLLSSYLFFISGTGAGGENGTGDKNAVRRRRVNAVSATLFFILGFTVVFVALSIVLYGFMFFLGGLNHILNIVAGVVVMLLGVNILFPFIPFLKYDDGNERCASCTPKHSVLAAGDNALLHPVNRPKGFLGSFLVGLAFGAGWTPCVGVFLGSILLLAGQSETLGLSAVYLVAYSAGLGVPFLAASVFWSTLLDRFPAFGRTPKAIKCTSGGFLIAVGAFMAGGKFALLNAVVQNTGDALSRWAQSGGADVRLIPASLFLLLALVPFAVNLARKRKPFTIGTSVWLVLMTALALANGTGLVNGAYFISRWFSLSGT